MRAPVRVVQRLSREVRPLTPEIDIYFRRLGASGATLVVVQIDRAWTHGAADVDPALALVTAARRASDALGRRGQTVDVADIVARGREELRLVDSSSRAGAPNSRIAAFGRTSRPAARQPLGHRPVIAGAGA
jgi:hypothetical protein